MTRSSKARAETRMVRVLSGQKEGQGILRQDKSESKREVSHTRAQRTRRTNSIRVRDSANHTYHTSATVTRSRVKDNAIN